MKAQLNWFVRTLALMAPAAIHTVTWHAAMTWLRFTLTVATLPTTHPDQWDARLAPWLAG